MSGDADSAKPLVADNKPKDGVFIEGKKVADEKVSNKPVDKDAPEKCIVRGVKGTVKWFSLFNHYGFINRTDNGEDIFCHLSALVQRGRIRFGLDADLEVEFDVANGIKGPKAIAVTLPGGLPVENTRIVRFKRNGKFGGRPRRSQDEDGLSTAESTNAGEENGQKKNKPRRRQNRRKSNKEGSGDAKPEDKANAEKPEEKTIVEKLVDAVASAKAAVLGEPQEPKEDKAAEKKPSNEKPSKAVPNAKAAVQGEPKKPNDEKPAKPVSSAKPPAQGESKSDNIFGDKAAKIMANAKAAAQGELKKQQDKAAEKK